MDTKNLSSHQVSLAQELSRYYFGIDYRQSKANRAADALSRFPLKTCDDPQPNFSLSHIRADDPHRIFSLVVLGVFCFVLLFVL